MADKTLPYESSVFIPVAPCGPVTICLDPEVWTDRTVSGLPFIQGTIESSGRFLGGGVMRGLLGMAFNPRNVGVYQYHVTFDDAQLLDDPETDDPWVVSCDDIVGVQAGSCVANGILTGNTLLQDQIDDHETRITDLENP